VKKIICLLLSIVISFSLVLSQSQLRIPETLLPLTFLDEIIQEASGELALQNEIILAGVERNRPAEEYVNEEIGRPERDRHDPCQRQCFGRYRG